MATKDVIIKDVPEEIESQVVNRALTEIEKFYERAKNEVSQDKLDTFETTVDAAYVANGKERKYRDDKGVRKELF